MYFQQVNQLRKNSLTKKRIGDLMNLSNTYKGIWIHLYRNGIGMI